MAGLRCLRSRLNKNPDAEIPASFLEFLQQNSKEIGIEMAQDSLSA